MFNLLCCVVLYIDSKSPIKTWLEKIHTFYLNCFEYSYIDRCLSWHVSTNFTLSQKASKAAFLWAKSKLGSGVGRQQTGVGILLPVRKRMMNTPCHSIGGISQAERRTRRGCSFYTRKQDPRPSLLTSQSRPEFAFGPKESGLTHCWCVLSAVLCGVSGHKARRG